MKFEFLSKNRRFYSDVRERKFLGKMIGLMFKSRNTSNMLFSFSKDVYFSLHSWFVFFPFLCLWLDDRKRVIEMKVIMPFSTRILPNKAYRYVLELPFNDGNMEIINSLVGRKDLNTSRN